jgi:hypothetical protein
MAGILAYANSISGPFILDDQSTIADNRQIREWWRPSRVLVPEADTAIAGRPIVNLSFAVNYAVGGLDVRGYHVANIAICSRSASCAAHSRSPAFATDSAPRASTLRSPPYCCGSCTRSTAKSSTT